MGLGPAQRHLPGPLQPLPARTGSSPTRRERGCGASSATASATSPRRSAPCSLAAREQLDNLIFVVNCNLQRLDGPVRGNGKIIQELEALLPGRRLERDQGHLGRQVGRAAGPRRRRRAPQQDEHDRRRRVPEVRHRVRRLHPRALLRPGPPAAQARSSTSPTTTCGPCPAAATTTASCTPPTRRRPRRPAQPTVILAKTIKGWTLGPEIEARNSTHQIKKMTKAQLELLRDRLYLQDEIPDAALDAERAALLPPAAGLGGARVHDGAPPGPRRVPAAPVVRGRGPRPLPAPPPDRPSPSSTAGSRPGRCRRRWPSPCCCATCCATRDRPARSCRSSPTRPAPSAWTPSSRR